MSFSVDWLTLREPFDHRARVRHLAQRFVAAAGSGPLLDLAGGTGSGARYLQGVDAAVDVVVVDHDPRLLREAAARGHRVHRADLNAPGGLHGLPPAAGVQAQALIDLVSWDWLDRFVDWVTARHVPLLVALTVDGRVRWAPVDPDDASVQAAFRAHQRLDRGFGSSPGTEAAQALMARLRDRGWSVHHDEADWQIAADQHDMVRAMIEGTAEAARVTHASPDAVSSWARRRAAADSSLVVGHVDVLALPPQR